jgi:hypothetical protein
MGAQRSAKFMAVGQHGSEKVIAEYVKRQGGDYRQLHKGRAEFRF